MNKNLRTFYLLIFACMLSTSVAIAAPIVSIDPVSTTDQSPGDTFSININVDPDGSGVSSGQVDLSFDTSILSVTSLSKGDMLGTDAFDMGSVFDNTAGTVNAVLAHVGQTTPPTAAGTWATVTFEVKTGASGTTNIAITSAGLVNETFKPIAGITTTNGTVSISSSTPHISIDLDPSKSFIRGQSFSINVSVDPDSSGIASGQVDLVFNSSILSVTSLSKGDILGNNALDAGSGFDNTAGTVTAVLAHVGTTTPPTAAGTWATVTFEVLPTAFNGTTIIGISSASFVDESLINITSITTTDGNVNITTIIPGNIIGGDDKVDYKDLGLLAMNYGLSSTDAAFDSAADLNGDGKVNYIDLGILAMYYGL